MIYERDVQALVEFVSETPPVLSVYLNVDSTQRTKQESRLTLRSLLKQVSEKASPRDIQAVERFYEMEYDGSARGIAIFSCEEQGFWTVYPLAIPVKDRAVVARRPYVTPLQDLLNNYARYGVVHVDQQGARLYLFDLGQLQEVQGSLGEDLRRHKQASPTGARPQRKADNLARQNLKEASAATAAFCKTTACERLILAGTTETVAAFRALLPRALREQVVGEIPMDTWAGEVAIRDKTMELIRDYIRSEDDRLVDGIVAAASAGDGALGLPDALEALRQERMQTLVVGEGYEAAGYRCSACGYLTVEAVPVCPYCGGDLAPNDHVVDTLVRRAIGKGVTVKIVAGNERLEEAGQVGALLRY